MANYRIRRGVRGDVDTAGNGQPVDYLVSALSRRVDSAVIREFCDHLHALAAAYCGGDWEKCLLRAGKFAECTMRVLHFVRTGVVRTKIEVEEQINETRKDASLPDGLRLVVPNAVRVLYDHRNRRGGAHANFDPTEMDCQLVVATSQWVAAELARELAVLDSREASQLAERATRRLVPLVERIGEKCLVLAQGMSAKQEILLILNAVYPRTAGVAELDLQMPSHTLNNIRTTLSNMVPARLVYRADDGYGLTAAGLAAAEKEIARASAHCSQPAAA